MKPAIGFDLGTSTSAAATIDQHGNPVVIPDSAGNAMVPSVLFFEEQVRVGINALSKRHLALDNYVEGFKRDVGKPHCSKPLRTHQVPPEVLTGFLIEHLAENTRRSVGEFKDIVVTVPAYFDERQRTATRRAVSLAGLNTIEVINEPTAAAIAAGFQRLANSEIRSGHKILVYDLGGGTFDATLLEVDGKVFRTLGTDGEVYLGGRDFNDRIVQLISDRFLITHGIDPRCDPVDAIRLSHIAREVKHQLTEKMEVTTSFEHAGLKEQFTIQRSDFEEAISPLIERSLMTCQATLSDAGLSASDVDEILLVGGSSQIPMVRRRLEDEFGRQVATVADPDQLVAKGAALYAAILMDHPSLPPASRFEVVNVNAHSLGIQGVDLRTKQPINQVMIPRNTPLPTSASMQFSTASDGQPNIRVRLLEGESEDPVYCTPLGQCIIKLDKTLPKNTAVKVRCRYDAGGTITVGAEVPSTGARAATRWRREGIEKLEPLQVWSDRLTESKTSTQTQAADHRSHSLSQTSSLRLDSHPDDLVQRLDELYTHVGTSLYQKVGSLLVNADRVSDELKSAFRLVQSTETEFEVLRELIDRVNEQLEKTNDESGKMAMQADLSQARVAYQQAVQLHQHSWINLGRSCQRFPKYLDVKPDVQREIETLEQWLANAVLA